MALALGACSSMSKLLNKDSSTSTQAAAASGDAISPDLAAADKTEPVGPLYNKVLEQMQSGEYRTAAKTFGEVERQHPYSAWATKPQLMQTYGQTRGKSTDQTVK